MLMEDYIREIKKGLEDRIPDFESADFRKITEKIRKELEKIDFRKPENILTDNNPFKEGWAELLANRESKPVSHTYITRKIKGKWNALSEIWQRNS